MTPHVLIQPSYGSPQAQQNWATTLAHEVDFTADNLRAALSDDEFAALIALHPNGAARFFAATSLHDKKMDQVQQGDVVLFTGKNRVRAVGEVGVLIRNADAGNALWPPDQRNRPYQNVYSLLSFQETDIPYEDLRKLTDKPGSKGGDNYMGTRLLRGEAAIRVIDGLLIETETELAKLQGETGIWQAGTVVDDESHTASMARPTPARPGFVAERIESALVVDYKEFLARVGDTRQQRRLRSVVGFSDLYLIPTSPTESAELVEAKSDASHQKVRESMAQLLDYAAHAHVELDTLSALFPVAPSKRDVEWLANFGIGCIYRASHGRFDAQPAPANSVARMKGVWQPGLHLDSLP